MKDFMIQKKLQSLRALLATDKKWNTISNWITVIRLLLAPIIVACMYYHRWLDTVIIFVIAAVTDLLDGHIARARNEQTHLGTFLDPIADKCLLLSVFGALAFFHSPFFLIPRWFFMLIFVREITMLTGSLILLLWFKEAHVQPLIWGKLTTLLQVLFLMWIFICYFIGWEPYRTYMIMLFFLAVFSLISLWKYISRAASDIRESI
jgi:cardiolipin synthase (CMP-forming)